MIGTKKGTAVFVLPLLGSILLVVLLALFFLSESVTIQLSSGASFIIVFILLVYYLFSHYFRTANKLRHKLQAVRVDLHRQSLEALKQQYHEIYRLYLKISEHKKQNFYPAITALRETIEKYLKTAKKIDLLLARANEVTMDERPALIEEITDLYHTLPQSEQQKYAILLAHAKQ